LVMKGDPMDEIIKREVKGGNLPRGEDSLNGSLDWGGESGEKVFKNTTPSKGLRKEGGGIPRGGVGLSAKGRN